jgi:type VI secretion system protein VasI
MNRNVLNLINATLPFFRRYGAAPRRIVAYVGIGAMILLGWQTPPIAAAGAGRCTVFDHSERKTHVSQWIVERETSQIDGSPNIAIHVTSQHGEGSHFSCLMIQCIEHKTSVYVEMTDNGTNSISRVTALTYKIDDKPWSKRSFVSSSDGLALGLWDGQSALPFINELAGGKDLRVQISAPSASATETDFKISAIDKAIEPVRSACHW